MELSSNSLKDGNGTIVFTEFHEHPEGGDRGGTLQEDHTFSFSDNGETVVHEWGHDYPGEASDFGLDEWLVDVLDTQEDAEYFVEREVERLKKQLAETETVLTALQAAKNYKDEGGYEFDPEDEEDED